MIKFRYEIQIYGDRTVGIFPATIEASLNLDDECMEQEQIDFINERMVETLRQAYDADKVLTGPQIDARDAEFEEMEFQQAYWEQQPEDE